MESLEEIHDVLDEDPIDIETFKEGAVLLTKNKDWQGLEGFYIRELRRIDDLDEDEIKFHLWYQLGQIYDLRLDELEKAEQAYQVALPLRPDHEELEDTLAAVQDRLEDRSGRTSLQTSHRQPASGNQPQNT
jgi:tetratricopeptide (TPR) repeat protein